ncbi:MAG: hypothetical protein AMJ81_05215 [Phycisphaerae bacterium SM23_33]|nr:MAG: hypothetical protein AMJ81_05215 [Phycisphaerae bacterium SM23_33]
MLAVLLLTWAVPAVAIIRVDIPVCKIYDTAQVVAVGTVLRVNPDNRVIDVQVEETLKGKLDGDRLRVQLAAPAELIKEVAAGGSLVIFTGQDGGKPAAVLHLADTWLLAEPIPNVSPTAWRTVQLHDLKQSFPGRTAGLARVVRQLKAGKPALLDKLELEAFRAGVLELAKLDVANPTFLSAADLNGDKKLDLLIGTAGGVRLFLAAGAGFEDATAAWGLAKAAGSWRALGDVNGDQRVDLLLGGRLWINDGQKLTAAGTPLNLPPASQPLAAELTDVTGDKKPDAVILLADGRLLTFENSGAPDRPWRARPIRALWNGGAAPSAAAFGDWGDDGRPHVMVVRSDGVTRYGLGADAGPPADHERLTGKPVGAHHKAHRDGLKNVLAAAIDVNGDRRLDLFVLADGGGLLLVNRGMGAFLVDPDAGSAVTSPGQQRVPFKLTPATPWTAADMHADGFDDLLVLTADGRLYEVSNPPLPVGDSDP